MTYIPPYRQVSAAVHPPCCGPLKIKQRGERSQNSPDLHPPSGSAEVKATIAGGTNRARTARSKTPPARATTTASGRAPPPLARLLLRFVSHVPTIFAPCLPAGLASGMRSAATSHVSGAVVHPSCRSICANALTLAQFCPEVFCAQSCSPSSFPFQTP